jgi:hypothetical protein
MYGDMVASTNHVAELYIGGNSESPDSLRSPCNRSWLVDFRVSAVITPHFSTKYALWPLGSLRKRRHTAPIYFTYMCRGLAPCLPWGVGSGALVGRYEVYISMTFNSPGIRSC